MRPVFTKKYSGATTVAIFTSVAKPSEPIENTPSGNDAALTVTVTAAMLNTVR
jgi:hypothetical protein